MFSLAEFLAWKYGFVASTKQEDPNDKNPSPQMVISSWNHPDIPQPNKEEIAVGYLEYKAYLNQKKVKEESLNDAIDNIKNSLKGKNKSDIKDSDIIELMKLQLTQELDL